MKEATPANETIHPGGAPDVARPTHRLGVPDASMSAQTESVLPAAASSLNRVVQGAHDAVDRFADSAAPKARQLDEAVSGAETALRAKADQLVTARDEWAESLRDAVRGSPLTAIAAALALGAVIARVTR